jgi:hypothetical protein
MAKLKMRVMSNLMRPELAPHAVVFTACVCILAAVFILGPPQLNAGQIALGRLVLPDVCLFHGLTGLPCPGCGLTRSMAAAVHGNISASFSFHRLGILTVFYILLQFLFNMAVICLPGRRDRLQKPAKFLNKGLLVLGTLFFINWVATLILLI